MYSPEYSRRYGNDDELASSDGVRHRVPDC
jgi:hypothetical protein